MLAVEAGFKNRGFAAAIEWWLNIGVPVVWDGKQAGF